MKQIEPAMASARKDLEALAENLSPGELQEITLEIARLAVKKREEGGGKELPKQLYGSPRDAVVQRIAGMQLRKLLAPKKLGGEGMSLRDVASMFGVTYERIRTLAKDLVEDYDHIMGEKRG